MKKFFAALALLLALVTVLSLVACGGTKQPDKNNVVDNNGDTNNDDNPDNGNTQNPDNGNTQDPDNGNTQNPDNGNTQDPDNGNTQNPDNGGNTVVTPPEEMVFEDRNEIIYAISPVYVRKTPNNGEKLGMLYAGDGITRIGYNEMYSKVLYDHDGDETTDAIEAYVWTESFTTENISDADYTVLATPDTYYCSAKKGIWLYPVPYAPAVESALAFINRGEQVQRISYGETWTKVTYTYTKANGTEETLTGYVYSSVISENDPITTKKFEKDGMSIVLGADFEDITDSTEGYTAVFDSEKVSVAVIKETFEMIEAGELDPNMTDEEYATFIIERNEFGIEAKTEDEFAYFVYTAAPEDGDFVNYCVVYKTEDAFWVFQFITSTADYEALSADFVTYAKSVTFDPVAEE